jgi:co-chaperonin GroES (HSP10)
MRHSFGSYHYALYGDSVATSRELGHKTGDDILFSHYRALVSQEDAEEYFSIGV